MRAAHKKGVLKYQGKLSRSFEQSSRYRRQQNSHLLYNFSESPSAMVVEAHEM
jgi:hypothetical protein